MGIQDSHYSAFISYRHLDSGLEGQRWAEWVQKHIEGYTTPRELVGQTSIYGDAVPAAMPRVFRDKDQLPAHGNLDSLLHAALDRSRVLIVLCSRASASSPWVDEEVRYFKKLDRGGHIIAVVLDGEPHSAVPSMECFPPSLRHDLRAEDGKPDLSTRANPVYIDLRPPRGGVGATSAEDYRRVLQEQNEYKDSVIDSAVQKYAAQLDEARILLVSGALGLSPVELTQRELLRKIEEQRQREIESAERVRAARRRTRMASAAAAILLAVCAFAVAAMVWALKEKSRAMNATLRAEEQRRNAEAATRRALEGEEAAKLAKANIISLLSALQGMSTWGGHLDDKTSEIVNEAVCSYYVQHPPVEADESGMAIYAQALNRRGDFLFGSGASPDDALSDVEKGRRQEATKAYRLALDLNTRAHSANPKNIFHIVNMAATYERIGVINLCACNAATTPSETRKKHAEDASAAYIKAGGLYDLATAIDPDNDISPTGAPNAVSWRGWIMEVAAKLEEPGSAENMRKLGEAAKFHEATKSLWEELIKKAAKKPQWQASIPAWQAALSKTESDIARVTASLR